MNESYSQEYASWSTDEYPPDWKQRRRKVLDRDSYRCQKCGAKYLPENEVTLDVDHIVPKSDGGHHGLDNLQSLCVECHAEKHPGNRRLARRAGKSPFIVKILKILILPLVLIYRAALTNESEGDGYSGTKNIKELESSDNRVGLNVEVREIWGPYNEDMAQVGLLEDETGSMKFVSWESTNPPRLNEGQNYKIDYAKVYTYNGELELKLDRYIEVK